jgi:uncharacterized protein (TIGR00661 family)
MLLKTQTENKTKSPDKKILFAALDWGLGHAVRDIPLIRKLINSNFTVKIAGSGASLSLLQKEFPELEVIRFHSNEIFYSVHGRFFGLKLLFQIPRFIVKTLIEHRKLSKILKTESYDLLISDNRYGFRNKSIKSIFITHQIHPKLSPGLKIVEPLFGKIHEKIIRKYKLCLIPDFPGNNNLSGELSHKKKHQEHKFKFIGIISDFSPVKKITEFEQEILLIVSGPEPQRTIFLNKVYLQIKKSGRKALIISGMPNREFQYIDGNITVVSHLSRTQMEDKILSSEIIITQSGYTSVMDLVKLRKKAILIPSTGQPEQEYLAKWLKNMNMFVIENRNAFNLEKSIEKVKQLDPHFFDYELVPHDNFIDIIIESFQ